MFDVCMYVCMHACVYVCGVFVYGTHLVWCFFFTKHICLGLLFLCNAQSAAAPKAATITGNGFSISTVGGTAPAGAASTAFAPATDDSGDLPSGLQTLRRTLTGLGVPDYGIKKYVQQLRDASTVTNEQLKALSAADWKLLELPAVIEDALRQVCGRMVVF